MTDNENTTNLIEKASDRATANPSLGTHLGYEVHIAIRDEPNGFAVNLYIPQVDGENLDIARVDDSGRPCHIDRLYLPVGHGKRKHDEEFSASGPKGAVKYFTDDQRWRNWVERYDKNHDLP